VQNTVAGQFREETQFLTDSFDIKKNPPRLLNPLALPQIHSVDPHAHEPEKPTTNIKQVLQRQKEIGVGMDPIKGGVLGFKGGVKLNKGLFPAPEALVNIEQVDNEWIKASC